MECFWFIGSAIFSATGNGTNLLTGSAFSGVGRTGQLSVDPEGDMRVTNQNFTEQSRLPIPETNFHLFKEGKKWGFDKFPK